LSVDHRRCQMDNGLVSVSRRWQVTFDPAWRTANAVGLATSISDQDDFGRLPILADALEDAGCTDVDILKHCREKGDHWRGCWVVDMILGTLRVQFLDKSPFSHGDHEALPVLLHLAQDPSSQVRRIAIRFLIAQGDKPEVINALLKAIEDSDDDVRQDAMAALRVVDPQAATKSMPGASSQLSVLNMASAGLVLGRQ